MILSAENTLKLAKSIAQKSRQNILSFKKKQFSDGERYYRLQYRRKPKAIHLLGNITADPESLFELMSLAQAAEDNAIPIKNLCIPYMAYGRQDRVVKSGEAVLAKMISRMLRTVRTNKMIFVTVHSPAVQEMLIPYTEISPLSEMVDVNKYDIIIAPDGGARNRAMMVSEGQKVITIPKTRPVPGKVKRMKKNYPVRKKKLLIVDDMIDTGRTIASAADMLSAQGAEIIDVAAVHGVFSPPSKEILSTKSIRNIYVSDSIPQVGGKKIKVVSLASSLAREFK
jgi:ribose-phosphate pyrophosphokinase